MDIIHDQNCYLHHHCHHHHHHYQYDQAGRLERLDLSYNNLRELDSATLASLTNLLVLKVTIFDT